MTLRFSRAVASATLFLVVNLLTSPALVSYEAPGGLLKIGRDGISILLSIFVTNIQIMKQVIGFGGLCDSMTPLDNETTKRNPT